MSLPPALEVDVEASAWGGGGPEDCDKAPPRVEPPTLVDSPLVMELGSGGIEVICELMAMMLLVLVIGVMGVGAGTAVNVVVLGTTVCVSYQLIHSIGVVNPTTMRSVTNPYNISM